MSHSPTILVASSRSLLCYCCLLALMALSPITAGADTLSETRDRGKVRCGVNPDLTGFSRQNSLGEFSGFDVDFCRAVSSAIFGSPDQVEFIPVSAPDRLIALTEGRYDLLSRNTTWTMERNMDYGEFVGVIFYDGQGFMVPRTTGIRTALELDNQTICVSRGTTTELNASDYFTESELRYKPVFFDDEIDAALAYANGDCSALTTDRSALAAQRASFDEPEGHLVLPEVISKEPLGPVVRKDDVLWENIGRWALNCIINAEELGVTQENVSSFSATNSSPAVRRLLGIEGASGKKLGLDPTWCSAIIATLGNYAEIYNRHIGLETPVGLDRGVNSLWTNGGLLYAPPIR